MLKFTTVVILLCCCVVAVSAQQYDCAAPLPRNFTHHTGPFVLSWGMFNATTIEVQFALPGTAYIAMGWGNSMTNHDCVIGWVESTSKFVVGDHFAQSHHSPPPDTQLGGKNDIVPVCGARIGAMTVIRYRRALNTGDRFDAVIPKTGAAQVFWAYNSGVPGHIADHHRNHETAAVTLGDAKGRIPYVQDVKPME